MFVIPKRIIQTGKSADSRVMFRAAAASLRLLNPDFEHVFFDDQRVEEFIDKEFPNYRTVVDSFPWRIQRYDFFRYLAVYRLGGFYFDLDVMLASSLTPLLNSGCVFPFERLTWSSYLRDQCGMDWEIGNYAFGAAAGHPFLEAVISNCVRAQKDREWREAPTKSLPRLLRDELSVIYSTGPGLVSRTLAEYRNDPEVTVLFPQDVCDKENWNLFGTYGIHLGVGSWRRQHTSIRQRLVNLLSKWNEDRAIRMGQKLGKVRCLKSNPK
jgi:mannosyltransferase OCH1-like enzyme